MSATASPSPNTGFVDGLSFRLAIRHESDEVRAFPTGVQQDLGYALYRVQLGQMPPDSKPMRTVGSGVYELRDQDERAWYRVFYLKKIADVTYVLHCFEKTDSTNRTQGHRSC
jgi:phage-related protein